MKKSHCKIIRPVFVFYSLFLFTNCSSQWVNMPNGGLFTTVQALEHTGTGIIAGTSGRGVYLSTNNGLNWVQTSLTNKTVWSLAENENYIFAGTDLDGVYLSTDKGFNWTQTSLNIETALSLAVKGNYVFVGDASLGTGGRLYLSTNNGASWNQTPLNAYRIFSLKVSGNYIYAGCFFGAYLSTNNGTSWVQTSLHETVLSLEVNGNNLFAGTNYGGAVYLSTNNGTSWTQTALNNRRIFSLALIGSIIFAGTADSGVYVSNDNGTSWIQRNEGLPPNVEADALCIHNNYIFLGAWGYGIYRRPLGELVEIKPSSSEILKEFSLSQNYPNPFNPVTVIRYSLIENGFVNLKVFDVRGNEIATLVNEKQNAGSYAAEFNGEGLPSGVYFYNLETRSFAETKRMILLK